jgi:hypothetical protein
MSLPSAVSNSSPLIGLARIGQLSLLEHLFATVRIPGAVRLELGPAFSVPAWIVETPLTQPVGPRLLRGSLGPGEAEAVSLALEVPADWILLDDKAARRVAQSLGLPVIGTLGILLASKRRELLSAVHPCLEALRDSGFHIAPQLYERVLHDAGETT